MLSNIIPPGLIYGLDAFLPALAMTGIVRGSRIIGTPLVRHLPVVSLIGRREIGGNCAVYGGPGEGQNVNPPAVDEAVFPPIAINTS